MSTQEKKSQVIAEPGNSTVTMIRTFDHPREKVFRAITDPELVAKWWGRGNELEIDAHEPHAGGRWRYIEKTADGDFAFRGVYHDVIDGERIISTFEFEGLPGAVVLDDLTLTDTEDGGTTVTTVSAVGSVEARDGMVASGMSEGAEQSYDALEKVLESL